MHLGLYVPIVRICCGSKKDSALVVGLGKRGNYIASDIPAILEHTRDVYILDDKEVVALTADKVTVYNNYGVEVKRCV